MSRSFQNRFVCALALIVLILCLAVIIRFSCNLIHANDTARQLMEQLQEKDRDTDVVLDQMMDLEHEMFFAAYGEGIMKPVSYDKMAECLENLESLNTYENFGRDNIDQALQKQIGQIVNTGYDLIIVSQGVDLELSEDYQEMMVGCIQSLKEARNQYTSKMIEEIKTAEQDIVRSAIMILISVAISAATVVPLFIFLIRREKAQERIGIKSSDIQDLCQGL